MGTITLRRNANPQSAVAGIRNLPSSRVLSIDPLPPMVTKRRASLRK